MPGKLYIFNDDAVVFLRQQLAGQGIGVKYISRRFGLLPSNASKLLSLARHPKRIQEDTFKMLCKVCPDLPQYVSRRKCKTPLARRSVTREWREEKDRVFVEILSAIYELEDVPGMDHGTLLAVGRIVREMRKGKRKGARGEVNADAVPD